MQHAFCMIAENLRAGSGLPNIKIDKVFLGLMWQDSASLGG
jgi:hypothetical protein